MNVISMFHGIIVSMVYSPEGELKVPHLYVLFQDTQSIFSIPDGILLTGDIPNGKRKLLEAWIELHKDELIANWQLAVIGNKLYPVDPLK